MTALQVTGPSCGVSELIAMLLQLCMLLETAILGSTWKKETKHVVRDYHVEMYYT